MFMRELHAMSVSFQNFYKGIVEIPQIFCTKNKPGYFAFYTYSHNQDGRWNVLRA